MMNNLKNILHSWDEADTYLKEKIEKSNGNINDVSDIVDNVTETVNFVQVTKDGKYEDDNIEFTYIDDNTLEINVKNTIASTYNIGIFNGECERYSESADTIPNKVLKAGTYFYAREWNDGLAPGGTYFEYTTSDMASGNRILVSANTSFTINTDAALFMRVTNTAKVGVYQLKLAVYEGDTSKFPRLELKSAIDYEARARIAVLEAAIIELGELVGGEG